MAGCATGPLQENPVHVRPEKAAACYGDSTIWLPQGPDSYGRVFEHVLDVVDDYFEIAYNNRYDGRIETFPRIAPGIGQPWKNGSPDPYQRLLATFQTIRYRGVVLIEPARDGGYWIDVKVYKELEDLEKPFNATAGAAVFRSDNTVERQFEVIDVASFESAWIPVGRDEKLEQAILERLACFEKPDPTVFPPTLNDLILRPTPQPTPIPATLPSPPPPAAPAPAAPAPAAAPRVDRVG
jgi:hypothetical protein